MSLSPTSKEVRFGIGREHPLRALGIRATIGVYGSNHLRHGRGREDFLTQIAKQNYLFDLQTLLLMLAIQLLIAVYHLLPSFWCAIAPVYQNYHRWGSKYPSDR
jgi:hypothetical protein